MDHIIISDSLKGVLDPKSLEAPKSMPDTISDCIVVKENGTIIPADLVCLKTNIENISIKFLTDKDQFSNVLSLIRFKEIELKLKDTKQNISITSTKIKKSSKHSSLICKISGRFYI